MREKDPEELKQEVRKEVKETYEQIKKMEIQGATDVALEAIKSLEKIKEKEELEKATELLNQSRPTEPMMRNGLKYIKSKHQEGEKIKKAVNQFQEIVNNAVEEIVEKGATYMPENVSVMTHCHSSLVEKILKEARGRGKLEKVIVTETRPRYQGRITAEELSEKGISVTVCVDSARIELIDEADISLVGADVITSDSYLLNKIGTHEMALISHNIKGKNFLVATKLLKIAPMTLEGKRQEIEERDPDEVWDHPPQKVTVRNPAFDATPPRFINSMITEHGIIHPFNAIDNARKKYPWIFNQI